MATKTLCSVCLRGLSVTTAGLIRIHGPVGDRCSGSRKPPKQPDSSKGPSNGQPPPPTSSPGARFRSSTSMDLAASIVPIPASRTLDRIPKAARYQCHVKLTTIMEEVVGENSIVAWSRLLHFPTRCLRTPDRSSNKERRSAVLASIVKEQVRLEEGPPLHGHGGKVGKFPQKNDDPLRGLARRVSSKIQAGDFKGAIRLASSEDVLADCNEETYLALQAKHPAPHPNTHIPPPPPTPISSSCQPGSLWPQFVPFPMDLLVVLISSNHST